MCFIVFTSFACILCAHYTPAARSAQVNFWNRRPGPYAIFEYFDEIQAVPLA